VGHKSTKCSCHSPRIYLRAILHNPYGHGRACGAFKSSPVMIGLIRLNAGEPHLGLAQLAKRTTDDALLGKYLIFSHATPLAGGRGIHRGLQVPIKRAGQLTSASPILQTNGSHQEPSLTYARYQQLCESIFRFALQFDRNMAARFHFNRCMFVSSYLKVRTIL